ncbi:MAG TPA: hypothetical protein VK249_20950 [Anaerolineales bacterium]|nr:hypothetical protein [Anaerolineales bacterium]
MESQKGHVPSTGQPRDRRIRHILCSWDWYPRLVEIQSLRLSRVLVAALASNSKTIIIV